MSNGASFAVHVRLAGPVKGPDEPGPATPTTLAEVVQEWVDIIQLKQSEKFKTVLAHDSLYYTQASSEILRASEISYVAAARRDRVPANLVSTLMPKVDKDGAWDLLYKEEDNLALVHYKDVNLGDKFVFVGNFDYSGDGRRKGKNQIVPGYDSYSQIYSYVDNFNKYE